MDDLTRRQVQRVHSSDTVAALAIAGGGVSGLARLFEVPGASHTVLEALVPYAPTALADFLGYEPGQMVAPATAEDMARTAYWRGRHLRQGSVRVVGIGCTASLATDRPKKGEHRCFISAWTEDAVTTYGLSFVKGLRGRPEEEGIVGELLLRALAEACGVNFDLHLALEQPEHVEVVKASHPDPVERLLAGHGGKVTVHGDGTVVGDEPVRGGVLAGSFDPYHEGHRELASVAEGILGAGIVFELSIANVDKPDLDETDVRSRIAQFAGDRSVVVTRAPAFADKARLFPNCTFIVGTDTAARLVDPDYYGGDRPKMLEALAEIRSLGCAFLVAGRVHEGTFRTLANVPVPREFGEMFTPIPEETFRRDVSSTRLRVAG